MTLLALFLGLTGFGMALWFSEGEFSGSAEEERRRLWLRRTGFALAFIALGLRYWGES